MSETEVASEHQGDAQIISGVDFTEKGDAHSEFITHLKASAADAKPKFGRLNPYALNIVPGWNIRNMALQDNIDHVDHLARLMAKLLPNGKPTGVQTAIGFTLDDGKFNIRKGHCRTAAVIRAIEVYGAKISDVPVTELKGYDARGLALLQETDNNGRNYSPIERGHLYKHLRDDHGMSIKDIAEAIEITPSRVLQCIGYHDKLSQSDMIMSMIGSGVVSVSYAADLYDGNNGDIEATEKVLIGAKAIAGVDDKGVQNRILPKHVDQFLTNLYGNDLEPEVSGSQEAEAPHEEPVTKANEETAQEPESKSESKSEASQQPAETDAPAAAKKKKTAAEQAHAEELATVVAGILDAKLSSTTISKKIAEHNIFLVSEVEKIKQWVDYTLLGRHAA